MSKSRSVIDLENQKEIGELRETISQLNTNVAVMAENLKSLKEAIDKDSAFNSESKRAWENRMTAVETKLDSLELEKAKDTYLKERLQGVETLTKALNERLAAEAGTGKRLADLERATQELSNDKNRKDGWSSGAIWAIRICAAIGLPSFGFVLAEVWTRVFH